MGRILRTRITRMNSSKSSALMRKKLRARMTRETYLGGEVMEVDGMDSQLFD